ncbi:uncharacterized protein PHACADRAFT_262802, partial [Phanerochaete carnosa HHB-10118-sp]
MKQYGSLKTHLNRHLSLLPYQCPHTIGQQEPLGPPEVVRNPCPFRTSDPAHLTRHRETHHSYMRAQAKIIKKTAKQAQTEVLIPHPPVTFLPPQWAPLTPTPHTVAPVSIAGSSTFQIPVMPRLQPHSQQDSTNMPNSKPRDPTSTEKEVPFSPIPLSAPPASAAALPSLCPQVLFPSLHHDWQGEDSALARSCASITDEIPSQKVVPSLAALCLDPPSTS